MSDAPYRICTRCVMDSTDPDIVFDEAGVCNYCTAWLERIRTETYVDNPVRNIGTLVQRIKETGKGREFDCIIGVSGGVEGGLDPGATGQEHVDQVEVGRQRVPKGSAAALRLVSQ